MRSINPVSQSLCKTERLVTNEFESSKDHFLKLTILGVERDDLTYKSIDRDINIEVVMNKYEEKPKTAHNKRKSQKEGDYSIDNYDNFQNSKLIGSINESQELHPKMLETSLNNSISTKGSIPVRATEKSPNVTYAEIKLTSGKGTVKKEVKKLEPQKKASTPTQTKPKTAPTGESRNGTLALDKSTNGKDLKIKDSSGIYPVSAISTPKNNLLSKILKDKPFVKDSVYSNKHKVKQETAK